MVNDRFEVVDDGGFASAGTVPSGVGPMTAMSRRVGLAGDTTESFRIEVRGAGSGTGVVQGRFAAEGAMLDGGDEASVQLGSAARTAPRGLATSKPPAGALRVPVTPSVPEHRPAPVRGPKSLSMPAPGASCATGRWTFNDENGLETPSAKPPGPGLGPRLELGRRPPRDRRHRLRRRLQRVLREHRR